MCIRDSNTGARFTSPKTSCRFRLAGHQYESYTQSYAKGSFGQGAVGQVVFPSVSFAIGKWSFITIWHEYPQWVGCRPPTVTTQWPLENWSGQPGQEAPKIDHQCPDQSESCRPGFSGHRQCTTHFGHSRSNLDGLQCALQRTVIRAYVHSRVRNTPRGVSLP